MPIVGLEPTYFKMATASMRSSACVTPAYL